MGYDSVHAARRNSHLMLDNSSFYRYHCLEFRKLKLAAEVLCAFQY